MLNTVSFMANEQDHVLRNIHAGILWKRSITYQAVCLLDERPYGTFIPFQISKTFRFIIYRLADWFCLSTKHRRCWFQRNPVALDNLDFCPALVQIGTERTARILHVTVATF